MDKTKFEYYMIELRIKAFERLAIETDPRSMEWEEIEYALKCLWTKRFELLDKIIKEKFSEGGRPTQ